MTTATPGITNALRRWVALARTAQLQALACSTRLDAACTTHMAHPAMPVADPGTDTLYALLEAPAAEGARAAVPYQAGQPTTPESRAWWPAATALLACLAALSLFTWP